MSFIPQFNPQVVSPGRIRRFNGVFGGANMVIQKADSSGRDLSDGFCNDQQDLNSDEKGAIHLREGFTKTGSGGDATIHSIFEVRLGGKIQYASVDGSLTLYDIPWLEYPLLPLPPKKTQEASLPTDFPATFDKGARSSTSTVPRDDVPLADPSEPPAQQACEIGHEHSTSPTALTFTMQKGGALPAAQNWYWQVKGWWDQTHYGTYNVRPAWLTAFEGAFWQGFSKPCVIFQGKQVKCNINSAAQALAAGTYTFNHNLIFTDGGSHGCAITLNVIECVMSVTSPRTIQVNQVGVYGTKDDLVISNDTVGSTLNWTAQIISDTSGVLQLASSSGTITGAASYPVGLSLSSIPSVGTYTAVVRVSGNGSPATIDVTVNITVALAYTGTIYWRDYCVASNGEVIGDGSSLYNCGYIDDPPGAGYWINNINLPCKLWVITNTDTDSGGNRIWKVKYRTPLYGTGEQSEPYVQATMTYRASDGYPLLSSTNFSGTMVNDGPSPRTFTAEAHGELPP